MKYLLIFLLILVGFGLYVRFAPSDPDRWHVPPDSAKAPPEGSFHTEVDLPLPPAEALTRLQTAALDWPRTTRLAGSPEEGRITFVTRSRLWGFPDYTTVDATPTETGSRMTVLARLRFGKGDMGVNRARTEAWLKAMQPLQQ